MRSNNTRSNKTRKSIYTRKNGKTKKNKSLFGGSNCKDFLINFEVSIDEIKKIIKGDKKLQPVGYIQRQIYDLLNNFSKIDENCDDISSKKFQELLNKVKDLKNYEQIGKPEYMSISDKLEEIIGKIETFKSIMESKELKKRETEESKKLAEAQKKLAEANKKEFNRLESERLKKAADERKQKVAEQALKEEALKEEAKKAEKALKEEIKRREAEEAKKALEEEAIKEEIKRREAEEAKKALEEEAIKEEIKRREAEEEIKRREAEEERIKMQQISEAKLVAEKTEFENLPQINLFEFLTPDDDKYLKMLFQTDLIKKFKKLFPNIATDYSQDIINNLQNYDQVNYNHISCFIIILIGVLNNTLKIANPNIKFALKGGKSAQMLISKNNIKELHIFSDDVDILVLIDGKYNRLYIKNISEQLADIIGYYVNLPNYMPLISILKPDYNPTNPNIVKVSFINSINGKYLALSDIDFKQIETPFFDSLEETTKYLYMKTYKFDLLYYHQNIQSFIDEKKFYLDKYSNIIQPTETGDCDCGKPSGICTRVCSNRIRMIEKFNKYIEPIERLSEFIQNK